MDLFEFVQSQLSGLQDFMIQNVPQSMEADTKAFFNTIIAVAVLIAFILFLYAMLKAFFFIFSIAYKAAGGK